MCHCNNPLAGFQSEPDPAQFPYQGFGNGADYLSALARQQAIGMMAAQQQELGRAALGQAAYNFKTKAQRAQEYAAEVRKRKGWHTVKAKA